MPRRFTESEQIFICKLIEYFKREKDAGKPILPVTAVYNRVSDALGVSLSTVQKLASTGIQPDDEHEAAVHQTIALSRGTPLHKVHEHTIRSRIYSMYAAGEHVTLRTLQKSLQHIDEVEISLYTLSKGLSELKFNWRKCTLSNRLYLMEQPNVAQKRLEFLRQYKCNAASEYALKPVFLDETWIYSKGAFRKSWQDGTLQTVRKKSGEGVRYIILHAGSEDGFVENASLIFKGGSKSGDYHDSMNCENFEKWFEHQLLPNLEEPSLIVMDNAAYHSGLSEPIPNSSWSKGSLIQWLEEKGITFPNLAMKDEIWRVVRKNLPPRRYKMDELALKKGHRILRLPPYHCHFNPIEMVWAECKRYFDAKISSIHPVTHNAVLALWKEAINQVTKEKWQNYFRHTNKLIDENWEREKFIDASQILPVIINLNDSDDSDDDYDDIVENV